MINDLLNESITQQDLLDKYNANITYAYLPNRVNGFVFCYKGINNIFINEGLPCYWKRETILHELAHIELNHFCKLKSDFIAFFMEDFEDEAIKYLEEIEKNNLI